LSQTDGLSRLGRLTGSPCLSYGFSSSVAQDSLVQVMRTMADANAIQTVQYLLNSVELSLNDTRDFWENRDEHSKLFPLLDIAGASTRVSPMFIM
jgi:E3 ubiquitin-protein ligase HUWE1